MSRNRFHHEVHEVHEEKGSTPVHPVPILFSRCPQSPQSPRRERNKSNRSHRGLPSFPSFVIFVIFVVVKAGLAAVDFHHGERANPIQRIVLCGDQSRLAGTGFTTKCTKFTKRKDRTQFIPCQSSSPVLRDLVVAKAGIAATDSHHGVHGVHGENGSNPIHPNLSFLPPPCSRCPLWCKPAIRRPRFARGAASRAWKRTTQEEPPRRP